MGDNGSETSSEDIQVIIDGKDYNKLENQLDFNDGMLYGVEFRLCKKNDSKIN